MLKVGTINKKLGQGQFVTKTADLRLPKANKKTTVTLLKLKPASFVLK